jgi:hypothetical protein
MFIMLMAVRVFQILMRMFLVVALHQVRLYRYIQRANPSAPKAIFAQKVFAQSHARLRLLGKSQRIHPARPSAEGRPFVHGHAECARYRVGQAIPARQPEARHPHRCRGDGRAKGAGDRM